MTEPLLSFHGIQKIKDKYLDRIRHHREMDNLVQGTGWSNGKGCAVGCTLENYNHSRYPIELGLPEWLAHLEDRIFEGLSTEKSNEWPELFLESIPVGVDTEIVRHQIAITRLNRLIELQSKNATKENYIKEVINALNVTKFWHEAEINKNSWDIDLSAVLSVAGAAWLAAVRSKESGGLAARSAKSAAESARDSAGHLAGSAGWAAESAVRSEIWSEEPEEWSSAWQQEANTLIECLKRLEK